MKRKVVRNISNNNEAQKYVSTEALETVIDSIIQYFSYKILMRQKNIDYKLNRRRAN